MKNLDEERYVFQRLCASDFQECFKTLSLIAGDMNESIKIALIKSAIISYTRGFTGNKAIFKPKSWNLDLKFVPKEHIETHEKAMLYRDKFIAHTDIKFTKPELLKSDHHFAVGLNPIPAHEYIEFSTYLNVLSEAAYQLLTSHLRKRIIK